MKIDLTKPFLDLEKKEIKDGEKLVTLKNICLNCLGGETDESMKESGEEKVKRFKLMMLIASTEIPEAFELSSEECTLLKNKIAKFCSALVTGQAFDMIEGK